MQKTGKVEARFSPNCDSMKEPEPVNLKGKLTHYQHAQGIGMTDDKNPYINPKFYFSEIKTLDPLPLDKGEVNTQVLTFRSDGKNLNQTKTQTKTQPLQLTFVDHSDHVGCSLFAELLLGVRDR